ncbi:hypothetical protein ACU8V3_10900 [Cobetia marina]
MERPHRSPTAHFCSNAMDELWEKGDSMGTFRFHGWTVVEIETHNGLVGLGNVAIRPAHRQGDHRSVPRAADHGQDPFYYEYLWQRMYRSTHAGGPKGMGMAAISWRGYRHLGHHRQGSGKPVFKLLGGRT